MISIQGKGVSTGVAAGPLYFYQRAVNTLRRYEVAYQKIQFEGLKPVSRISDKIRGPFPGFDKALEEAILLKREVPSRSVNQIIFILEAEGIAKPGQVTRPTLQRYLYKAGFGKKQMKKQR